MTAPGRGDAPQEEIDSRFFAIVTDLVGAPTELVDEQGDVAWHTCSTLWGTTAWAANSTAYTPLRFPGQYYDPETGLHYNCFRHYGPETARYLTPDPLGLSPAPNPAAYVHNPTPGPMCLGWRRTTQGARRETQRVRRLAAHYACADEAFIEALVAMATERTQGWWEEYRGVLPPVFLDVAETEHHGTFLREVVTSHTNAPSCESSPSREKASPGPGSR